MSMDLTGITNKNEYFTNHYFSTVFEENASATISGWNARARGPEEIRTPWSLLRQNARQYYTAHDKFVRSSVNMQTLANIRSLADHYLRSLGYPEVKSEVVTVDDGLSIPVYLELTKNNGAPLLWVLLSASKESDAGIMESFVFNADDVEEDSLGTFSKRILTELPNEDLVNKIFFAAAEPPRFVMLIGMNQIALIDRNKWNEKRYLQFELEEIFSRLENTTLQAMAVLLHKESLCPDDGKVLLDELDEQSQKNASGVSQDLKYALRESIELLGNEVLYDMKTRLGCDLEADPVDAGQLTLECLRYMYRMLFILFIEARPELGYAPIKAQSYYSGYSLESLRDIADNVRDDVEEVGDGYYLHETLSKLYELIYDGYPKTEEELKKANSSDSLHDMFLIAPLKAHIFDPEYTQMITAAKLRNSCMLRIIDLMSLTRATGKKKQRRGRISYANLGINQMGAVYEALLSYRGFIAEQDLYEVKRSGDSFNELDVGYFVPEAELDQYTEDERVRYEHGEKKGKLRMYEKGTFIYRLAGREREKSASYYTPEVLTKCLVKYALKELLEDKTADEILELTVCEPAMGSAAFLNEAINQLAEAYISRKEKETGVIIGYEDRFNELQKVKMYIADRNVYGIDLNPVAVELAEVSLWLNTIYEGGFVPWFGTQLVNGNSLIGARRQVYRIENAQATSKGMRWYELEPERVPLGKKRMPKKQIYHFLLGDPGMCNYTDKVIKSLEPENIKKMAKWRKTFTVPINDDEVITLLRLSAVIDDLWEAQVNLRKEVDAKTQDALSVFGHRDETVDSHTTIRQKDKIFSELYKSEHMKNAGPYARLKFAMDYWCALWFWPIDQADLLPTRSEFLFDMSLILEGTMASVNVSDSAKDGQLFLFPTEMEQMASDILDTYGTDTIVDIPRLRQENPRLDLAAKIAEQNKFMHWELEFADLFAERGGFDLIIGNPPWIKISWNESVVLGDAKPMFSVRKLSATQVSQHREDILSNRDFKQIYYTEYQSVSSEQVFLNSIQNYAVLVGLQANLYKCFIPQAWAYCNHTGVFSFIHPESIYTDPSGGELRKVLYKKLRKHYQFQNEKKLFEIGNRERFSINIYSNKHTDSFETIANLIDVTTVDNCYENPIRGKIPGIKDENDNWSIEGHIERVVHVSNHELKVFAKLFDDTDQYGSARLPAIHAQSLVEVLRQFADASCNIADYGDSVFVTRLWGESSAQEDGTIEPNEHFPEGAIEFIYSGPHIGVANPIYQTAKRVCNTHRAYESVDLTFCDEKYLPRTKYSPCCSVDDYRSRVPATPWGEKYIDCYRVVSRKRLNLSGERTLISCISPPNSAHIDTVIGIASDVDTITYLAGIMASLPYDFYVKIVGASDINYSLLSTFPIIDDKFTNAIKRRALLLNALNREFVVLWERVSPKLSGSDSYAIEDNRLNNDCFSSFSRKWSVKSAVRDDFSRRQLLVELDVLAAMALGMTLEQLVSIYRIQFPVLQSYESDTWYDANGRIIFTNNRSFTNVGFSRFEWEKGIKDAPSGQKFYRKITDDTIPGGPVERIIEYVAPFDCRDREKDYEIVWKCFEKRYKNAD